MAKAKKAKLHTGIPQEWKRWLVQRVRSLRATTPLGSSEKHTQETELLKALRLYRESLEETAPPQIVARAS